PVNNPDMTRKKLCTMVHVFGTNSRREIPQVTSYPVTGKAIFANGCLHSLVSYVDIKIQDGGREVIWWFDVNNEEFRLIDPPKRMCDIWRDYSCYYDHLVDLNGEVLRMVSEAELQALADLKSILYGLCTERLDIYLCVELNFLLPFLTWTYYLLPFILEFECSYHLFLCFLESKTLHMNHLSHHLVLHLSHRLLHLCLPHPHTIFFKSFDGPLCETIFSKEPLESDSSNSSELDEYESSSSELRNSSADECNIGEKEATIAIMAHRTIEREGTSGSVCGPEDKSNAESSHARRRSNFINQDPSKRPIITLDGGGFADTKVSHAITTIFKNMFNGSWTTWKEGKQLKVSLTLTSSEIFELTHTKKCAGNGLHEFMKLKEELVWAAYKEAVVARYGPDSSKHPMFDVDLWESCSQEMMSSITSLKCVLTQEHLDAICAKYFVPEEVHPQLPSSDATMHERPTGKVGMYTRFFDYANYRIPFSTFFVSVLTHFRIPFSQLSVFGSAKFVVPANARFSWFSGSNIVKDRAPAPSEYNVEHINTLIAQASPFLRFPEEFLCWVGISRNYLLNKDTYPRFEYEDGEGMDLNAFIRTADPRKVRIIGGPATGGKSPSVLNRLLQDSQLTVEQGVPSLPTLPFITSFVTASPLEEGGDLVLT
ncbi:hypothetical protein Tco_1022129, partial [Tanacetum coccineum]